MPTIGFNLFGADLAHLAGRPTSAGIAARPTQGGQAANRRVTSLAKDGPGILAEALAAKGKHIIVFEVGGAIDLERSVLRSRSLMSPSRVRPRPRPASPSFAGGSMCAGTT